MLILIGLKQLTVCIETFLINVMGEIIVATYLEVDELSCEGLQSNHRFQVNLQRRIYGHDTQVLIHPLNPEKAVQAASDILGEFTVFAVLIHP